MEREKRENIKGGGGGRKRMGDRRRGIGKRDAY